MRPQFLADVVSLTKKGESFALSLANFLDEFYYHPTVESLNRAPELLAPSKGEIGQIHDAYLAAVAEELARKFSLPYPRWADADERKLKYPWFASPLASLRAVLIVESPAGFRSRNLFVSENALSRV
jgi:hypothetical protein